ncbi:WD repeat and SOCS box-containing protein 1 isoform X3 [Ursus maritimus]|uniref:WD repeat and SOCS box-containing protein 1 isoform X3 n=1 Tax=Ursus maritimus TaxID=29073 RepID=A0A8M1GQB8_URSMA|nr:WD repeat and SOCS box-containing protein 1 isoform X3 [Ursus maritimus]
MASFPPRVNEKEIVRSRTIGELLAPAAPFDKKCGRENWTVAFAPDGSYFAWSQGHRTVKLVPWSQCLKNFLLHGTKNITNSSSLRLSRQNSDGGQKNKPREHIIDCGDIVWSLAFGSSVPEKQSRCVNIEWHRFRFGQDQLLLATGLNNGRIKIWDVYTGKLLLNLVDHTEVVRDLTFAPDGSLILVSASRDKTLRVWDLKDDGNMMKVLRGHQNWVYSCAFSPDSSMLCSVGASKAVFLWDMDKYTMIQKLEGHHHDVVACDFSPDGALLATASYDTRVYIWDPHTGDILMEFGHLFPPPTPIFAGGANDRWVRSVSFSHDGLHVASLADDKAPFPSMTATDGHDTSDVRGCLAKSWDQATCPLEGWVGGCTGSTERPACTTLSSPYKSLTDPEEEVNSPTMFDRCPGM